MKKQAFTLIELLVVVLIIGILAAVAVPQYQRVVEKSKATEALTLLKSTYQAAKVYFLANGEWPTKFEQLDIDIPWTGHDQWTTCCGGEAMSNKDWSLQLLNSGRSEVMIGRLSGKYHGAGFWIQENDRDELKSDWGRIVCEERISHGIVFTEKAGSYCEKLFGGTFIPNSQVASARVYSLAL